MDQYIVYFQYGTKSYPLAILLIFIGVTGVLLTYFFKKRLTVLSLISGFIICLGIYDFVSFEKSPDSHIISSTKDETLICMKMDGSTQDCQILNSSPLALTIIGHTNSLEEAKDLAESDSLMRTNIMR